MRGQKTTGCERKCEHEPRVELRDVDGQCIGRLTLAGTVAVLEDADDRMADFLERLTVVEPGVGAVTLGHGERYLPALHGPHLSTTVVRQSLVGADA
jgi:hypothetical protein